MSSSNLKVLFYCDKDWANLSSILAKMLRRSGVKADAFKVRHHGPRVAQERGGQAGIKTVDEFLRMWKKYDVIVFMHSAQNILVFEGKYKEDRKDDFLKIKKELKRWQGKKIFVGFHGSSFYRKSNERVNSVLNKYVSGSIIQTGDLLDLGAKNEVWIQAPVDTDLFKPDFSFHEDKLIFSHYPSIRAKKNSDMIDAVFKKLSKIDELKSRFVYETGERLSHSDNMKRVRRSDVYVDHQAYTLYGGKPYGEFGIAALEAAALGCVTVSCTKKADRYEREYGELGLVVSNSPEDLEKILKDLVLMSRDELLDLKLNAHRWASSYHSYSYIANKMKRFFEDLAR